MNAASDNRRHESRQPAAFTVGFRGPGLIRPAAGWMVNLSHDGGAFLVESSVAPGVGQKIEFDGLAAGGDSAKAAGLPRFATVVRCDALPGLTRRVAVVFDQSGLTHVN